MSARISITPDGYERVMDLIANLEASGRKAVLNPSIGGDHARETVTTCQQLRHCMREIVLVPGLDDASPDDEPGPGPDIA